MLGMLKALPLNTMAVPSQKFEGSVGQNNVNRKWDQCLVSLIALPSPSRLGAKATSRIAHLLASSLDRDIYIYS